MGSIDLFVVIPFPPPFTVLKKRRDFVTHLSRSTLQPLVLLKNGESWVHVSPASCRAIAVSCVRLILSLV